MLKHWMTEDAYRGFVAHRARRMPYAQPGVVPVDTQLFGWSTLGHVLAAPAPDVLVVRESQLLEVARPRTVDEVRELFARKTGIVVRRAERHDEGLAQLADAFAHELGGSAHIQLFVTPGQSQGFGWHYDEEDVCILQTQGVKTYYFRQNTQQVIPGRFDFMRIQSETSPLMSCTLIARDMLYLPRHMWHAAKADEDSLSVSIGVR
jgi:quercetin dioxygenase-like cupin family protein